MNITIADLRLEEEVLFGVRRPAQPVPAPPGARPVPPPLPHGLEGLRILARREPGRRFNSLLHYVDVELLECAYRRLHEEGVKGGSGRTWTDYGQELHTNVVRLYSRLQRGVHRTLPSWRRAIAIAQGRREALKRAMLKDRIVQRAVAEVLHAVYGADLMRVAGECTALRLSHDAHERFVAALEHANPHWVVEVDLSSLAASLESRMLLQALRPRIGDPRVLDLIRRWLKAGILDDSWSDPQAGPPGSAVAALLVNVYCHYAFDLWALRWRQRHARSPVILVRDASRFIAAFQYKPAARRYLTDLRMRLRQYAPALPTRAVRLVGFRRYARERLVARKGTEPSAEAG